MLTKELKDLSRSEKLLLISDLWEDIAESADDLEISPELVEKLDRRYDVFVQDPEQGVPWQKLKARFQR